MSKKTKIIATVGPACQDEQTLRNLIEQGVDVFRFNLKHADLNWHEEAIKRLKRLNSKAGTMIDLQGPELRVETETDGQIAVSQGEPFLIAGDWVAGRKSLRVKQKEFFRKIKRGDELWLDNGQLGLRVLDKRAGMIEVVADRDYLILNNKSLNAPRIRLGLPRLTDKDKQGLKMAKRLGVDMVGLSFVRSKKDVEFLRTVIKRMAFGAEIIAKVENKRALERLTEIIDAADGIMIGRGDLGVEIAREELAYWQKKIIYQCRLAAKPVVVATQMLQSMTQNMEPTRAEVSDVANAVFDGADALMLSEETAMGQFPARAVREMRRIATFCEKVAKVEPINRVTKEPGDSLVEAGFRMMNDNNEFDIGGIVVFTASGRTARLMASYRPKTGVAAVTDNASALRATLLAYGVVPYWTKFKKEKFDIENKIFDNLMKAGLIKKEGFTLVVHGNNWLSKGATSSISIRKV